jgi:hypothetical protein
LGAGEEILYQRSDQALIGKRITAASLKDMTSVTRTGHRDVGDDEDGEGEPENSQKRRVGRARGVCAAVGGSMGARCQPLRAVRFDDSMRMIIITIATPTVSTIEKAAALGQLCLPSICSWIR